MFPTVRVSFSGPLRFTQPADRYAVLMDIVPTDVRRYRYAYHRSAWLVAGKADPPPPPRLYAHPDSPISVDVLRKQVVSFEKVKLTNNEMDKSGQVQSIFIYFNLDTFLNVCFFVPRIKSKICAIIPNYRPFETFKIAYIFVRFLLLNYDRLSFIQS